MLHSHHLLLPWDSPWQKIYYFPVPILSYLHTVSEGIHWVFVTKWKLCQEGYSNLTKYQATNKAEVQSTITPCQTDATPKTSWQYLIGIFKLKIRHSFFCSVFHPLMMWFQLVVYGTPTDLNTIPVGLHKNEWPWNMDFFMPLLLSRAMLGSSRLPQLLTDESEWK